MKIKIVTLGCSKNLVDSEMLGGYLLEGGVEVSPDFETADAVVVNTCGFIDSAREESVMTILGAAEEKKEGNFQKLYVMGCMSEKFGNELKTEIPEIDGIYGIGDFEKMTKDMLGSRVSLSSPFEERLALESNVTTYLRISDGCNNRCGYCSIPSMRGNHVSRKVEDILSEVSRLKDAGVKEFIVIGQETTSYGIDLYKKRMLPELLSEISETAGDNVWIRLMYTHPPFVDTKLLETIAQKDNIINYIDFPIEHTEERILKLMGRADKNGSWVDKITQMKNIIPDVCIRTSIITGYPTETVKEFNQTLKTLEKVRFDRLGCFPYSPEPGTKAYSENFTPKRATAIKRMEKIMAMQQNISLENNLKLVGREEVVLTERIEGDYTVARTYRDAPEIDNEVLIKGKLNIGEFYRVKFYDAEEFDLYAEIVKNQ